MRNEISKAVWDERCIYEILTNYKHMLTLVEIFVCNRAGGRKPTTFEQKICSGELIVESKIKSIGCRVNASFVSCSGVYVAKIIGENLYVRRLLLTGDEYYEKIDLEKFIRRLPKIIDEIKFANLG